MISQIKKLISDKRFSFLLVGGFNTFLGFVVYTLLTIYAFHNVPFGYIISLFVSYAVGITVGFFLYRKFVYKVTGNLLADFFRFTSVYVFSIGLNLVLLPVFVQFTPMGPIFSQALVIIFTTLVSYLGHEHFSFKRK